MPTARFFSLPGGGGIYNNGTLTVTNCTFSGNLSGANGGGIRNNGTLKVTNSTFSDNLSDNGGGGIYTNGALTVTNSTFSDNNALVGGGIENEGGTVTVANSTFSSNVANNIPGGGGILSEDGTLAVTNSTFSGNSADVGGGIHNTSSATLKGTILMASGSGGGACGGTITDDGYNIADDGSCMFSALTSISNSTKLHLDPAGLQNNGGPTNTIALEPNSQARGFDKDCTDQEPTPQPILIDQRLLIRPNSPSECDSGPTNSTAWRRLWSTLKGCR